MSGGADAFYQQLAESLRARSAATGRQYWVGIAGGPGAGKSTLSHAIAQQIADDAVVLPMDGFHLYREELDQLADPAEAHARRGAPFTFDGTKFRDKLRELHTAGEGLWPSFDHAVGDPVEDDIRLERSHRVVLVEGNYLLLDEPPWNEARSLFDETWFVSMPEGVARERVARRNACAWGWSLERTLARVDANDVPNMRVVASSAKWATRSFDGDSLPPPPSIGPSNE